MKGLILLSRDLYFYKQQVLIIHEHDITHEFKFLSWFINARLNFTKSRKLKTEVQSQNCNKLSGFVILYSFHLYAKLLNIKNY